VTTDRIITEGVSVGVEVVEALAVADVSADRVAKTVVVGDVLPAATACAGAGARSVACQSVLAEFGAGEQVAGCMAASPAPLAVLEGVLVLVDVPVDEVTRCRVCCCCRRRAP